MNICKFALLTTAVAALAAPVSAPAQPARPAAPQKSSPTDLSPGLRSPDLSTHVMNDKSALPAPRPQDWRTIDPDNLLVIDTNKGRMIAELAPTVAPASVARVKTLARQHFYDGLTFFRVIENFMDQTGDPKNTGEGGSSLPNVPAEFSFRRGPAVPFVQISEPASEVSGFIGAQPVASQPNALMNMTADGKVSAWGLFCPGVLGMARAADPDSANSQFYIMRATYSRLNKDYTVFGRVVVGLDVARAIKLGEPVEAPQDRMVKVRLASDLPAAERPVVRVLDPSTPAFLARVEQARIEKGDDFTMCDVDIPVQTP